MAIAKRAINKIRRYIDKFPAELAYKSALKKHAGNPPLLSSDDLNVIETLRREGIFCTSLEALGITSTPLLLQFSEKLMPNLPKLYANKNEYYAHATLSQLMEYP